MFFSLFVQFGWSNHFSRNQVDEDFVFEAFSIPASLCVFMCLLALDVKFNGPVYLYSFSFGRLTVAQLWRDHCQVAERETALTPRIEQVLPYNTTRNKKLVETSASLLVTSALLVVTRTLVVIRS